MFVGSDLQGLSLVAILAQQTIWRQHTVMRVTADAVVSRIDAVLAVRIKHDRAVAVTRSCDARVGEEGAINGQAQARARRIAVHGAVRLVREGVDAVHRRGDVVAVAHWSEPGGEGWSLTSEVTSTSLYSQNVDANFGVPWAPASPCPPCD